MDWTGDLNAVMGVCHDCGAKTSQTHKPGCDVERCPCCGRQLISCGCLGDKKKKKKWIEKNLMPWTGLWPGAAECREFGWYAKMVPGKQGWHPCSGDDPDAREDLNRLYTEATWDREKKRFVRR